MSEPFPAGIYAETVLAPNFEDAKRFFLDSLLQIHHAHTQMLRKQSIITPQDKNQLLAALHNLDRARIEAARYDGSCEDLFFFVEGLLEEACGRDVAGKMHTARSRNDIAITLYRMTSRRELLGMANAYPGVAAVLLNLAGTIWKPSCRRTRTPSRRSRPRWRTICWRRASFWAAMRSACAGPSGG